MKIPTFFILFMCVVFISGAASAAWNYRETKDDMRGTSSSFATITSTNTVNFDFPYQGGSQLDITIRKKNGKLEAVLFSISKGQFSCGLYDCKGAVRFDKADKKGSVQNMTFATSENHSSDLIFAQHEKRFFDKLKQADKIIIELPFYQYGKVQFEFDVKGLKF